jgi:cytoskeleton protein RodZ
MSDVAEAAAAATVSAGTLLRRTREAAGLHVAALAVPLKVPVRKLEALEQDRYEDVGDAVFIRALASSVCRTLKADPQPILERLPQTSAPRLKDDEGLNTPFRAPNDAAPPGWVDKLRQPVPLIVTVLLIGAVGIALFPMQKREEAAAPAAAAPAPAPVATSAASEPAAAADEAARPVETAAVATAEPAAVKPAEPASMSSAAPAAAAASGIVVFRTKGESWVEVVDAKGAFPLRKLMTAGESAGASGALPLQVTIGKVDMTDVQVRGKPFDLKSVSRDNVARFQVK